MMMKSFAAALAMIPLIASHSANARDRQQIVAPVLAQYSSVWSAKRSLLKAAKKHANLSGNEYYTLAVTCEMDRPGPASIILTLLHKADCKEKVPDFFVEAGNRGVPEGFVEAGKYLTEPAKALFFADVAYLVSGNDPSLQTEAYREIGTFVAQLPQGKMQAEQIEIAATRYAQQRVADHVYAGLSDLPKSAMTIHKVSSDFEAFAPDHILDVREQAEQQYRETYLCPTPMAAQAVVQAVPQADSASPNLRERRFESAVEMQHCAIVKSGKFKAIASFQDALMSSDEPDTVWEALAATDSEGQTVGLLFNVSIF